MNSQELRELIREQVDDAQSHSISASGATNKIMSLLTANCYLKAERELPKNPYTEPWDIENRVRYAAAQQGVQAAGWRPVEMVE